MNEKGLVRQSRISIEQRFKPRIPIISTMGAIRWVIILVVILVFFVPWDYVVRQNDIVLGLSVFFEIIAFLYMAWHASGGGE